MIPLIPSPGIPKIVSTPHSISRSIRIAAAVFAMNFLLMCVMRGIGGMWSRGRREMQPRVHGPKWRHLTDDDARHAPENVMTQLIIRFIVGGLFVSAFALIGSMLKPKSFAGLFGAAPSVALATLALTISKDGKAYAAVEARSMVAGAAALFIYCVVVMLLLKRTRMRTLAATSSALAVWLGVAIALWWGFLK